MKRYFLALGLGTLLSANGLEYKGNLGIEYNWFDHDLPQKRDDAFALRGELELKRGSENGLWKLKAKSIYDLEDANRRYIDFQELYYRHDFENSELLIGRNTLFWGALEVYNLVDVFNTKDTLDDPFDYDRKLGAWSVAWTRFFDNGEVAIILRLKEEDQKMQERESVFNFLPQPYDSDLLTEYDNRPSLFVKYSASAEGVQLDYALIYEAGYDSQRYFTYDFEKGNLRQHAYWVNKVMGYATLVHKDTIYKAEAAFAVSDDVRVSDYMHAGVGIEHTLYGIWSQSDLGLLAEYYRYEFFNDTKLSERDLGILFQNDLYLGGRFSFNDTADSEVIAGIDFDLDASERIYFVKYDTRLWEHYRVEVQYQHLSPSSHSLFSEIDHAKVTFGYYF